MKNNKTIQLVSTTLFYQLQTGNLLYPRADVAQWLLSIYQSLGSIPRVHRHTNVSVSVRWCIKSIKHTHNVQMKHCLHHSQFQALKKHKSRHFSKGGGHPCPLGTILHIAV